MIAQSIVLAVAILAVSTASIFVRYAQAEAPSLVIASYRLIIASLVIAPVAWRNNRQELRALKRKEWLLALASGVFLAIHFATWITSLEYTTVASSVVLVSTSPLWVALASWLLFRERLTRPLIVGLALAVLGGAIVNFSETQQLADASPYLGNALALSGGLAVAGYFMIGRRLRAKLSLVPYVTVVYGMAAVTLLLVTLTLRQPFVGYSPRIYIWFILLGLVPQLIGHSSLNWTLAQLPATFVALATLGEPIGSTILAYLFLGEAPTPLKIFGAALILSGILFTLRSQTQQSKPGGECMIKFSKAEKEFLEKNEIGRLATIGTDGMPHIVPVSYVYQSGVFWVAVDYGTKKYSNLKANRKVALVVDALGPNKGLLVQGLAEIIERGTEFQAAYNMFYRKLSWVRAEPWKEGEAPFIKITPSKKSRWGV